MATAHLMPMNYARRVNVDDKVAAGHVLVNRRLPRSLAAAATARQKAKPLQPKHSHKVQPVFGLA